MPTYISVHGLKIMFMGVWEVRRWWGPQPTRSKEGVKTLYPRQMGGWGGKSAKIWLTSKKEGKRKENSMMSKQAKKEYIEHEWHLIMPPGLDYLGFGPHCLADEWTNQSHLIFCGLHLRLYLVKITLGGFNCYD